MIRHLFFLCLAIDVLMGCTTSPAFSAPPALRSQTVHSEPAPQLSNLRYTLGPLDVLEITLYERPELGREVTISRQGTFRFPLIGQVRARGLTVVQLEKMLTLRLQSAHIPEPHVVVTVKTYHNHHIFLLGQVHMPGVYALPEQVELKDFIIQAQGLTEQADDYLIIIPGERQAWFGRVVPVNHLREVPGTRVDLGALMSGQVAPAVRLRSGDTIYVPRRLAGYAASRSGYSAADRVDPAYIALQTH
jgi:protein involved in polysaccharide export with SLBB domain